MAKIFISHDAEDQDFAVELEKVLENEGFSSWLAMDDIDPSVESFSRQLEMAVESCAVMIVVMSKNGRTSDWVEKEVFLARELEKPIFIARIDDERLPIYLINHQATDFREKYRKRSTAKLIRWLKAADLSAPVPADAEAARAASGPEIRSRATSPTNYRNFFKYLRQLTDGDRAAKLARKLYSFAKSNSDRVEFSGFARPGFHVRLDVNSNEATVFSVLAYSRQPSVEVPFQRLLSIPPYDERNLRLATLDAINRLLPAGEAFDDDRADGRPNIPMTVLSTEQSLETFKNIVLEMIENLRGG